MWGFERENVRRIAGIRGTWRSISLHTVFTHVGFDQFQDKQRDEESSKVEEELLALEGQVRSVLLTLNCRLTGLLSLFGPIKQICEPLSE